MVECSWQYREVFRRLLQHLVNYFLGCCCCYWHTWTLSHVNIISASIPPGKAPLSQRTVSSLAEHAPLPGTWHPVRLQPAGRGRSYRRPTRTRWGSKWSAALQSTLCSPGQTGDTSGRHTESTGRCGGQRPQSWSFSCLHLLWRHKLYHIKILHKWTCCILNHISVKVLRH